MVDNQIDGNQRIDLFGVTAERLHAVAHGGEVDDARYTREVLQDDTRGHEWYLNFGGFGCIPVREIVYILFANDIAIAVAQNSFEQNPNGKRQPRDLTDACLLELLKTIETDRAMGALERSSCGERILFQSLLCHEFSLRILCKVVKKQAGAN